MLLIQPATSTNGAAGRRNARKEGEEHGSCAAHASVCLRHDLVPQKSRPTEVLHTAQVLIMR
jgi:hypothetical protein